MPTPGDASNPARIAIIGAGPAGFYAAGHLLKQRDVALEVDLMDMLPVPYGLVRSGVAPDHQKIKNVQRVFDRTAAGSGFRFLGNVHFGTHLSLDDLKAHYHQVCFTTGAQVDRRLNIPGEDFNRSYSATDFVAWYNGHSRYRDLEFDLSMSAVAVVGVGNVAVDVCRILCRTVDELRRTDMADYAIEALAESKVRTVYMLGRRGPAQAAFTNPEAKELGELEGADICVLEEEAALDPLSQAWLESAGNRLTSKKVALVQEFSRRAPEGKARTLVLRFLVSPEEYLDDGAGNVGSVRLRRNVLVEGDGGRLRSVATDKTEVLPAQVVFRSVGYRGVALPGLPFNHAWGVVPSEAGRVLDDGQPVPGVYVAGWIKRGPTGVIGTNKPDALETVKSMLADLKAGQCFTPLHPARAAIDHLVRTSQPSLFTWEDWQHLDALELAAGQAQGRPRVKFVSTQSMAQALGG